jgi:RpiR family carbohydrate utilization transcriptional regulator
LNLLQHIDQSRHLLRKSELKVAEHVLLDPAAVMHSSMADLAHNVGISEPTIVRFCRAIGCTAPASASSPSMKMTPVPTTA